MESKGNGVLSNSPKKDRILIPTLNDQDQEGDGEGRKANFKADADVDATIDLLLDEIRAIKGLYGIPSKGTLKADSEKGKLDLWLDDARKELHCTPENLAADAASTDFEVDHLKRTLKALEVDKATLADSNVLLEAEISALGKRLLAAAEGKKVDILDLQNRTDFLEMKVLGLSEDLWHSMEQAEAAVKEQVKIREEREEVLKQAIMALKETKARLEREERKIAGILRKIDSHLVIQGEHDSTAATISRGPKVSQVVTAVASIGALAAAAVTVCLRNIRQSFSMTVYIT